MSLLSCCESNMNAVDGFGCSCLIYILSLHLLPFFLLLLCLIFLLPWCSYSLSLIHPLQKLKRLIPDEVGLLLLTSLTIVLYSSNHLHELTSLSSIKHHVVYHTYWSRDICVMRPIRLRVCNNNWHNIIMSGYFLWLRAYKVLAFSSTLHDEWKHVIFYACLL